MLEKLKHGQVVKGIQKCSDPNCQKDFKWVYVHTVDGDKSTYIIPTLSEDEEMLTIIQKDTLEAKCYCSHCGRNNFFKVEKKTGTAAVAKIKLSREMPSRRTF